VIQIVITALQYVAGGAILSQLLPDVISFKEGMLITALVFVGITLIGGGGYHGKSTLLQTIAQGIYNHVPGDGREQAVTNSRALKIRAYSGRYVEKVNIAPFISNLPGGTDTSAFSTENASGSTSQAASLIEGLEAGAEVLLMDEDTCASNFMIRDKKMQQLVHKEDEPITPFIDRARQLFSQQGVSTILVLGGSGDYFEVSDTIIQMKAFIPVDVTEAAHEIERSSPAKRKSESLDTDITPRERIPLPHSIDPINQYRKRSVYAKEVNRIAFGRFVIDLADIEQILELEQTKGIMHALEYIDKYVDGNRSLAQVLECLQEDIETKGLDVLSPRISGNLAYFRPLELACALNRLRSLRTEQRN
jgi:predicted ABC-class ATPase